VADEVRIWQVAGDDSLKEVKPWKLDLEERIENWISKDISILVPDGSGLLVIGRQVKTDFGGEIDLLCMDSNGDLVIVELKRDKTPREVTAQALDYASWVESLDSDQIEEIASGFLPKEMSLRDAFENAFEDLGLDLPEVINGQHSIVIVASKVDDSTERIIRYLSSKGININFVRFHMFKAAEGDEFLVRTFTIPLDEAEQNVMRGGKTKHTSQLKTLEVRLKGCMNEAECTFLKARLEDPAQAFDKRKVALLYRIGGKTRFSVRARGDHAHVIQIGRFGDDLEFWNEHLSSPKAGKRKKGESLGFALSTSSDFEYFQHMMEKEASKLKWLPKANGDEEEDQDDEK
jgi:hypothetical protein